jgi:CHAT domain-containing protein
MRNASEALRKDPSASQSDQQDALATRDQANKDYQAHLHKMRTQGGIVSRQAAREVAPLARIQAAIPADTTLVVYALGDSESVVSVITGTSAKAAVLNVSASRVSDLMIAFAQDRKQTQTASKGTPRTLYDLIVAPIRDQLKTRCLIVVPDGSLAYAPFAALQAPDERYLIDDYTISVLPSATILVQLADRKLDTRASAPGS